MSSSNNSLTEDDPATFEPKYYFFNEKENRFPGLSLYIQFHTSYQKIVRTTLNCVFFLSKMI